MHGPFWQTSYSKTSRATKKGEGKRRGKTEKMEKMSTSEAQLHAYLLVCRKVRELNVLTVTLKHIITGTHADGIFNFV